jgi:uncharacterized protein (DUF1499 family)
MQVNKTLKWTIIVIVALVALRFGTAAIWPIINDVHTGATPEYPDLQAQHFKVPPDKVFDATLALARASGWEVVMANAIPPATGKTREIHAVATTRLWRFKDDVTISIAPEGEGTVVNMHSQSRIGKGDFGANARRIRQFQADLAARLAG